MANEPDDLSVDDVLEESRGNDHSPGAFGQPLPGDGERPASPAANPRTTPLPEDHPIKDSNIDPSEAYDIGEDAITELPDNTDGKESL